MLVDTGFGTLPLKEIVSGLTPLPVFVVNTHTDGDHTACNNDFDTLYMHPSEMDLLCLAWQKGRGRENQNLCLFGEGDVIDLDYWKFEVLLTRPDIRREVLCSLSGKNGCWSAGILYKTGRSICSARAATCLPLMVTLEKLDRMKDDFDVIWPSHSDLSPDAGYYPWIDSGGAQALAAGELTAQAPDRDMPCPKYRCDVAGISLQ